MTLQECQVDLERYLGTWYEVARLPHSFEKDLEEVTATYLRRSDGRIQVINAGYRQGRRKEARATAWVADPACLGRLWVRFFWPFKSAYRILILDREEYQYALVGGAGKDYLWILSRSPKMSEEVFQTLVSAAAKEGYDVTRLIRVKHTGTMEGG